MNGECSHCHSKPARYNNTLDMGGSVKVVANTDWSNCHEEYAHSYVNYNLCEDCQRKLHEFMQLGPQQ